MDNLLDELCALEDHLTALAVDWERTSRNAKLGNNTRKDMQYSEFARGRATAYEVAAGKVSALIEGMK